MHNDVQEKLSLFILFYRFLFISENKLRYYDIVSKEYSETSEYIEKMIGIGGFKNDIIFINLRRNIIMNKNKQKDIIDICFDIVNNNVHYTFEWSKDFGYIEDGLLYCKGRFDNQIKYSYCIILFW